MLQLSQFFDKYQVLLYVFYQNVYEFLSGTYNFTSPVYFFLLIIMGILTVLTPCFVSMLPFLFTYVTSVENQALTNVLFVFGVISSVFLTFLLSNSMSSYTFFYKLPFYSYLILILVSLNFMRILNFSFFTRFFSYPLGKFMTLNVNLGSYIMGIVIGFGSTPCNTSIILIVIFLLKHSPNILILSFYLLLYLLSCFFTLLVILDFKIDNKNFAYFIFLWNSIFPLTGSILFVFSLLSLLRKSFL